MWSVKATSRYHVIIHSADCEPGSATAMLRGPKTTEQIPERTWALWQGWAGNAYIFLSSSGGGSGGIVSLLPHYADATHLSMQEALKERSERVECVWEIRWGQLNLQSWLKDDPSGRICEYWCRRCSGGVLWVCLLVCDTLCHAQCLEELHSFNNTGNRQHCGNNAPLVWSMVLCAST